MRRTRERLVTTNAAPTGCRYPSSTPRVPLEYPSSTPRVPLEYPSITSTPRVAFEYPLVPLDYHQRSSDRLQIPLGSHLSPVCLLVFWAALGVFLFACLRRVPRGERTPHGTGPRGACASGASARLAPWSVQSSSFASSTQRIEPVKYAPTATGTRARPRARPARPHPSRADGWLDGWMAQPGL